jgi:hypothetical protein
MLGTSSRITVKSIVIQCLAIIGFATMFVSSLRRISGPVRRFSSSAKSLSVRSAPGALVKVIQKPAVSSSRRNMLFRLGALAAFASSSTVASAAGKQQAPIVEYFRADYKPSDFHVSNRLSIIMLLSWSYRCPRAFL